VNNFAFKQFVKQEANVNRFLEGREVTNNLLICILEQSVQVTELFII
jgi:hypothetical protein